MNLRKSTKDLELDGMHHLYNNNWWGVTSPLKKFKRCWANTLWQTLRRRGPHVDKSLKKLIECDLKTFEAHMEKLFQEGMTWENMGHGKGKWTINHVRPVASFDGLPGAWVVCFNYRNLQPLWLGENCRKSSNYSKEDEVRWIVHMRECGFEGDLYPIY